MSAFGKFPAFEKNWKPSDFNFVKALMSGNNFNLKLSRDSNDLYSIILKLNDRKIYHSESIRDLLHFDFCLSEDLIEQVLNDNKVLKNKSFDKIASS